MIYVTQGHESGVGLEIFLKSFILQSKSFQRNFKLICYKDSLTKTLNSLFFKYCFKNSNLIINNSQLELVLLDSIDFTQSNSALLYALDCISKDDILITLPTSKDQFQLKDKYLNGHTEFFRKYYEDESISMNFISNDFNVCLLTDHICISDVENSLSVDFIIKRVTNSLNSFKNILNIKEVIFSGINPHNGEDGLISTKDQIISLAINKLSKNFSNLEFSGPHPSDTIQNLGINSSKLFVYSYHDQGLNPFKLYNGLVGINVSFGMPFLRLSVDHGTAFNLYGKNSANYNSMSYLLNFLQKKAQA
jgi:4-hydroxythreonine-4-phosphate dehydrogenase